VPVPIEWPLILEIAGFKRMDKTWGRVVSDASSIMVAEADGGLEFRLSPSIGTHTGTEHAINAVSAAIMFKTMMTLGERANSRIIQCSLVGACKDETMNIVRVLAEYPIMPLRFENLCAGFRAVLAGGIPQGA